VGIGQYLSAGELGSLTNVSFDGFLTIFYFFSDELQQTDRQTGTDMYVGHAGMWIQ
jgi:hypothetical protein